LSADLDVRPRTRPRADGDAAPLDLADDGQHVGGELVGATRRTSVKTSVKASEPTAETRVEVA
jgi:hypothetical protein